MSNANSGEELGYVFNGTSWSKPVALGVPDQTAFGVSCPTGTFCVALAGSGKAFHVKDGAWVTDAAGASVGASSLSCTSVSFCVAVGGSDALTYVNGTWSKPMSIDPNNDNLTGVSCPTTRFCVAVDQSGVAFIYDGSHWSEQTIASTIEPTSVSCPTTRFCVAAAESLNGLHVEAVDAVAYHN